MGTARHFADCVERRCSLTFDGYFPTYHEKRSFYWKLVRWCLRDRLFKSLKLLREVYYRTTRFQYFKHEIILLDQIVELFLITVRMLHSNRYRFSDKWYEKLYCNLFQECKFFMKATIILTLLFLLSAILQNCCLTFLLFPSQF